MKLEQAKALFFAQYLGQQIEYRNIIGPTDRVLTCSIIADCESELYSFGAMSLLLRSVSQLTDEEIEAIADMYGWGSEYVTKDRRDDRLLQFKIDLPCIVMPGYKHRHLKFVYDYLTRIGILLPFTYLNETNTPVTLQPHEIIAMGWVKLLTD